MNRLGIKAKFYYNAGNYATPTWTAIDLISDLTVAAQFDMAEGNTRETHIKRKAPTLVDLNVTGKIRKDESVAGFEVLEDAFLTGNEIDVLVMDGLTTSNGADGYRFHGCIGNWGEDQGLGNIIFKDFAMYPGFDRVGGNLPKSVEVAAGAPVFTALTLS